VKFTPVFCMRRGGVRLIPADLVCGWSARCASVQHRWGAGAASPPPRNGQRAEHAARARGAGPASDPRVDLNALIARPVDRVGGVQRRR